MKRLVDICEATGKVAYATRSKAFVVSKALQNRQRRNSMRREPNDIYRCTHCHLFHLGKGVIKEPPRS